MPAGYPLLPTNQPLAGHNPWIPRLLWIDSLAGLLAGSFVLALHVPLSHWYGLPAELLRLMALANLAYGSYSFTLACRRRRGLPWIVGLAVANGTWAGVCAAILVQQYSRASVLGLLHVGFEGLFVAALGLLEWRFRRVLTGAPRAEAASRARA